jgi:hypothetical protein
MDCGTVVVSIMEFEDAVRETQYFGNPFAPDFSRAQWAGRMD